MNKNVFFFVIICVFFSNACVRSQEQAKEQNSEDSLVYTSEGVVLVKKQAIKSLVWGSAFVLAAFALYKIKHMIMRNSLKYHLIKHMSTNGTSKNIYLPGKQFDLLDQELKTDIKNQISLSAADWMNEPWNFELPKDAFFRGCILEGFSGITTSLGIAGCLSIVNSVYDLFNLPQEGDPLFAFSPFMRDTLLNLAWMFGSDNDLEEIVSDSDSEIEVIEKK